MYHNHFAHSQHFSQNEQLEQSEISLIQFDNHQEEVG
jgi:hypothetical protein